MNGVKSKFSALFAWFRTSKQEKENSRLYWVPDIMFNPITWILFQVLCTSAVSYLLTWLPYAIFSWMVAYNYLQFNPMTTTAFYLCTSLIFILLNLPETDDDGKIKIFDVPGPKFGALLTLWGMVLPAFLTTGKYYWTGRRLGFSWFKAESTTIANAAGFVNLDDTIFKVWNSANAESKVDKTLIVIPAKNRAPISGSLTLILKRVKPRLWLNVKDAGLDVGERARQEYQEIIEHLNDTDVAAVQSIMSDWMIGRKLITSFITKNVGFHKAGAIMRDERGLVMITPVGQDESVDEARIRFVKELSNRADPAMLKEITKKLKNASGVEETIISVSTMQASSPITDVIEERGFKLKRVTYGDITLSKKVNDAAEQASSEADERRAQLDSAKTNRDARKLLMPTPTELANPELFQLTTILAAAGDDKKGNVKIVHLSGANSLTSSLVAAATATQTGGTP